MTGRRRWGRVRRLESGRWQARYPDGDGRLVSAGTYATKGEAERALAAAETDQRRGAWTDPRLASTRFDDWVTQWWATTTNLRPSSRDRDRGYLNRYVLPTFGKDALGEISQLKVRSWVAELAGSGLAPATVNKAYVLLGKVMGAAVDADLILTSPCRKVPLPKVERAEMRFLNPAEIAALAAAMDERYRAMVLLAAYGGLRLGELCGLKRSRVDILRRRVEVAEIIVESEGHLFTGPPKTRAGRRSIAIPGPVADALGDHIGRWSGVELVFTAPEGGPLRAAAWRSRYWRPAVKAAGLEPLRPHDLRHTAVALWIAQGGHPKQIAARAGHASVSFTLDRYGHLFEDADDDLMGRLGDAFVPFDGAQPPLDPQEMGHVGGTPLSSRPATRRKNTA